MRNSTARRSGGVLILGILLLLASVALGTNQRAKAEEALRQSLRHEATLEADTLILNGHGQLHCSRRKIPPSRTST
jgi:hypothetical protein